MRSAPTGTQVVQRVSTILKAFSPERAAWRLTDLAEAVDLPKSTTHRLLAALESEGLVRHDPESHMYELGPAAQALGRLAVRGPDLRAMAYPVLEALSRATRETGTLEVLVEGRMLIAEEVVGEHLVNVSGRAGTRWPLHATASGKAVLARLPTPSAFELLDDRLEPFTPGTIVDRRELETDLERVRELGFATTVDELEIGLTSVASAIVDDRGQPIGALALSGPSARLDVPARREIGSLLARAAAGLSERLG